MKCAKCYYVRSANDIYWNRILALRFRIFAGRAKVIIVADGLMLYIKTEHFYEDIKNDIEQWFDTSTLVMETGLQLKQIIR